MERYRKRQEGDSIALNERIKLLRQTLKLSQREFGERLGVSRDVISNIEYGRAPIKDLLVKHLCELYGVNEVWLRRGEGQMFERPPKASPLVEEAAAIFQALRPEFQDYALAQIKGLVELQEKLPEKDSEI